MHLPYYVRDDLTAYHVIWLPWQPIINGADWTAQANLCLAVP